MRRLYPSLVSAYRAAPPPEPVRPRDVRTLRIPTLGMLTLAVWVGLALVTGVVIAAALHWSAPPGTDTGHALR